MRYDRSPTLARAYGRGLRDGMEIVQKQWREWAIRVLGSHGGALAEAQVKALGKER